MIFSKWLIFLEVFFVGKRLGLAIIFMKGTEKSLCVSPLYFVSTLAMVAVLHYASTAYNFWHLLENTLSPFKNIIFMELMEENSIRLEKAFP